MRREEVERLEEGCKAVGEGIQLREVEYCRAQSSYVSACDSTDDGVPLTRRLTCATSSPLPRLHQDSTPPCCPRPERLQRIAALPLLLRLLLLLHHRHTAP